MSVGDCWVLEGALPSGDKIYVVWSIGGRQHLSKDLSEALGFPSEADANTIKSQETFLSDNFTAVYKTFET